MSNYNVLADLITKHTDEARTQAERIMRASSVKAHAAIAKAAERSASQHLTKAEIKQLRAEAKAQAAQLSTDLYEQAARLASELRAKA